MKRKKTNRPIALALAVMLACQPFAVYAADFADMNQVAWAGAKTSIHKAASLGLVVGETKNGKTYFRPKDSVSLSETCQLAYKLLIQTGKAAADTAVTEKWLPVLTAYGIQEWAHPAVSFCLEKEIISSSALSGFLKNGSNLPATREQAASILGYALTVGAPSYTTDETATSFQDDSSISSDAKPYVALLKKAGVVNGDDFNRFNPKNTLNRTETAILVTNLYRVLEQAETPTTPTTPTEPANPTVSTQKGTIANMTNFYVNLKNSDAYYMLQSTGISVTLNGSSSSMDAVTKLFKAGTAIEATLTLDSSLRITKLEATYQETKKTKGTLTKVRYSRTDREGDIVIDKDSTYTLSDSDDVDIRIDRKAYTLKQLYDLFTQAETDKTTIEIEVTLDSNGKLTKITGTTKESTSSSALKGIVSKMTYDKSERTGYIQLKNKTTKYYIDDTNDVTVRIDGKTNKDYRDLYNLYDDNEYLYVELTLNSKEYVTKIVASTDASDSASSTSGEIANVTYKESSSTGSVKIGSKTYTIADTDDVTVDITDSSSSISTWENFYNAYKDKKTMTVSVDLKRDEIVKITGRVTETNGEYTKTGSSYLSLTGKYSKKDFRYKFDADATEDIKASIDGIKSVTTLEELITWLNKNFEPDEDTLTLTLRLDKNGYITRVDGTYK